MLRGRIRIAFAWLSLSASRAARAWKAQHLRHQEAVAGQRQQVFPGGVPGVEDKAPLVQPSNSNVSLGAAPTLKPVWPRRRGSVDRAA